MFLADTNSDKVHITIYLSVNYPMKATHHIASTVGHQAIPASNFMEQELGK